ncbi:MAG TPA: isoprenylcysteine carboxylmethyltransferase family protein [Aggregatilinea sp.]|jgi:protein-S-isoprenylcysteine O-methyltransferase Ste14|uniref:methyltransferase family protein n=1 Tax=Aggregatilinea sp. TaxID=2806333 RepID=UPI002CD10EE0|nr:isoprenylcysteine carboxylmethyltransferase family protein [Aggregatilinea sp.]HML24356.1 isoprenylcysteine carboxylmethyltransferase family protein [Aggregatilinea sp.]
MQANVRQGVLLWARKQVFYVVMLGAILFVSAGTLTWAHGWIYLMLTVLIILADVVVLLPDHADLLVERAELQEGTKKWDVALAALAVIVFPIVTWGTAGLDKRSGWSEVSTATWVVAVIAFLAGSLFVLWAMVANAYFSATVRIQTDRNHRVVSSGPYRLVRHPGYTGAIVFQLGMPLVLDSWWALIPSACAIVCYVIRTALEDRTLQAELPGYENYAQRVRYRLLPGVW